MAKWPRGPVLDMGRRVRLARTGGLVGPRVVLVRPGVPGGGKVSGAEQQVQGPSCPSPLTRRGPGGCAQVMAVLELDLWAQCRGDIDEELCCLLQYSHRGSVILARHFLTEGSIYWMRPSGTRSSSGATDSIFGNDEVVDGFGGLCAHQSRGQVAISISQSVTKMIAGEDRLLTK